LQPDALPGDVAELPLDIEGRMDDRYVVGPLPGVAAA